MRTDHLVYEHWRTDTNAPFYVGKSNARKRRPTNMSMRNEHHKRVVAKVRRDGFDVVVKIVYENLPEESAFALEKMRIAYWRSCGVELTNATDGGDGMSGYVFTDEQRARCSEAQKISLARPEVKAKRSAAFKGRPKPQSVRDKVKQFARVYAPIQSELRKGAGNPFFGRKHTEETKDKIRASQARRRAEKELCGVAASGN